MSNCENQAWCPLPWMSVNVRNNGDLRVCCNANVGQDQGLVKKEDGSFYNLGKDGLHDFRNADLMKEIRKSMINGEFHPSCIRCERETNAGMQSRAYWERIIWKHHIDEDVAKELTDADGSIDIDKNPVKYMDMRFGNLCNLKCRMCGPTDSNQWYEDTVKLWGPQYKDSGQKVTLVKNNKGKYHPETDIYSWYENPNFWLGLEKEIYSIERLYIVGGEPLMIDQHYEFLQKCIDLDRAKKIIIEYNSNLTNIPERAWKIWKHFKRVQIGISLDAIGPLNDYIRNPSKWWKIEENMRKLDVAEGNFKVWWAATVQIYNMVQLPEIMMWKIRQGFNRINKEVIDKPVISPHPLHNPKFLNIKMFPKESKEWISKHFAEWKDRAREEIPNIDALTEEEKANNLKWFCNILDHYEKYMWAEDYSEHLQKFWYYNKTLDESRSESLKDVCPKTWELLLGDQYDT
jgi:sulfatase maturation enzyme AslB (radical SAM superfamily)